MPIFRSVKKNTRQVIKNWVFFQIEPCKTNYNSLKYVKKEAVSMCNLNKWLDELQSVLIMKWHKNTKFIIFFSDWQINLTTHIYV